ncbi:Putative UDP-glucuronosyltransferase ugt-47, partial [Toxocara canis]
FQIISTRSSMSFTSCLQLLCVYSFANAANILIYSPSYSKSHLISNGRIADVLSNAGHNVVMLIPEYERTKFNGTKHAKVIRIANVYDDYADEIEEFAAAFFKQQTITIRTKLKWSRKSAVVCEAVLRRKDVLDHLRSFKFDVAFSEQIEVCGLGLIRYLGIQNHIWVSSCSLTVPTTYTLGVPTPLSYVPVVEESGLGSDMSFTERAYNMFLWLQEVCVHRYAAHLQTQVFRKMDPEFPHLNDVAADSALCFVNNDEFLDLARPILHKIIYVGGIGIPLHSSPLAQSFESLMSKGKNGVVLMSFGTLVPSSSIPMEIRVDILRVFAEFIDYHFLIRADDDDNDTRQLLIDMNIHNIDLVGWIPQSDMLGHGRLRLFIMHGGLNGMLEAVIRGVPLLVIPFFGDQYHNAKAAQARGIGLSLEKYELDYAHLKGALKELLGNEKYHKAARRLSAVIRNKPNKPEEQLVKWTEFVAKYGSLPELQVEGAKLNFIKYFGIDIFAVVLFLLFTPLMTLIFLIKRTIAIFCKRGVDLTKKTE